MPDYWMPLTTNEPDIDPQIPCLIGRILMRWSGVEEAFHSDIEWLLKHFPTKDMPKYIPMNFDKMLKEWHRMVRTVFASVPLYITAADEIREVAKELANWRNNLTHGLIHAEKDGSLTIVNIKRSGKDRVATVFKNVPIAQLEVASNDIKRLEDEIRSFTLNHAILKTHLIRGGQS